MIIACDQCYARYKYDENRFEGKASRKVRCTKCLAVFEIANPRLSGEAPAASSAASPDETISRPLGEGKSPPDPTTRQNLGAIVRRLEPSELKLPAHAKLSLAVIAGPESGRIFLIEKARVVIGRHDADINVDDPEISRQHAALEISGEKVMLVDLGSTNGTFMGEEPVKECEIENQGEFSIGGSTLMLIVTRQP
ncbi:MAG TPA: FHA domain-containing protein [Thermoanaerobaculia bacterium]|nr:FHA domain-containing protein [Thermoanaerobaculia bacterium]